MSQAGPPGTPRRSPRDWLVDAGLFLLAAAYGLLSSAVRARAGLPEPEWLLALDQIVGALGCAALWLRRRWPVPLAIALVILSAFSETVAGSMLVALFTVAVHRQPRVSLVVFGLSLASALCFVAVRPDPDGSPPGVVLLLGLAVQSAAVGWGLFIRHRRQLLAALRERAERAEHEARLEADQGRRRARDEIARDIHDALGHRLSLLAVHAGALEYRQDAPAEEIERAAAVIRTTAHQALQDLREVVGVLRAPVPEAPTASLAAVPQLVADSRAAGMTITSTGEVAGQVPEATGRTAYRVLQEGLTNARKHAPHAAVAVNLVGRPGDGLCVTVTNDRAGSETGAEGRPYGQGLAGLAERVVLAGGRFEAGPAEGGWHVRAWLPWPK